MLVDIGKETNSLEYREEVHRDGVAAFNRDLVMVLERGDRLEQEELMLDAEKEITRKRPSRIRIAKDS
jgi:hypothetical protein